MTTGQGPGNRLTVLAAAGYVFIFIGLLAGAPSSEIVGAGFVGVAYTTAAVGPIVLKTRRRIYLWWVKPRI